MNHKASPDAGIARRDFLIVGAATLGAAATMSAATARPLSVLKTSNPYLSVGFAEAAAEDVQAAGRLGSNFDGAAARVKVHGLWRGASRRPSTNVDVSTFYDVDGRSVPFLAWSASAATESPAVSFTVPVDESGHVALGVEQRPAAGRGPVGRLGRFFRINPGHDELPTPEKLAGQKSLCRLGLRAGDGLKLRRGTYFVALLQDGDAEPRWRSITAAPAANGGEAVLRLGEAPVDFDYVVISVDVA